VNADFEVFNFTSDPSPSLSSSLETENSVSLLPFAATDSLQYYGTPILSQSFLREDVLSKSNEYPPMMFESYDPYGNAISASAPQNPFSTHHPFAHSATSDQGIEHSFNNGIDSIGSDFGSVASMGSAVEGGTEPLYSTHAYHPTVGGRSPIAIAPSKRNDFAFPPIFRDPQVVVQRTPKRRVVLSTEEAKRAGRYICSDGSHTKRDRLPSFARAGELRRHYVVKHNSSGLQPVQCLDTDSGCPYESLRKDKVIEHMRKHHPDKADEYALSLKSAIHWEVSLTLPILH
jgi:hypothetical protein